MAGIVIKGLGYAHGDRRLTNDDMTEFVETSDEWIRTKTGIRSRFFAEGMTNAELGCEAAEKAIANAGVDRSEIRWLIYCTFTPDDHTPATACAAAGKLGLGTELMALDVNGACSGFIYGCNIANGLMNAAAPIAANGSGQDEGARGYALVIGSEKISPRMDMTDRATCVLFGDGAGAAVLGWDEDAQFSFYGGCEPEHDVLYCDQESGYIHMNGQEVYRFAVSRVPEAIETLMERDGITDEMVDWYVLHQANERIIDSSIRRLRKPQEIFYKNMYEYGNTSAASIPIALAEMADTGKLGGHQGVVCTGFGAGLSYGSMYIEVKNGSK